MFIATLVTSLLLDLLLLVSATGKLRHDPMQMGTMQTVGFPADRVWLPTAAEVAGAVGLAIGAARCGGGGVRDVVLRRSKGCAPTSARFQRHGAGGAPAGRGGRSCTGRARTMETRLTAHGAGSGCRPRPDAVCRRGLRRR
ncbi:DoxX family protein [Streptomyces sp. B21-083]|uniref:DoxX family protein n=1 Tax=Streptomyces sp. B21-083 TaxID=3039410 RepID=UPI003FA71C4D